MTNNGAICNVMCPAELMHNFSVQMCAYDNDVIQLFLPLADFTQPINIQTTLRVP